MPKINWEEFSEIKHHTTQERTIVCAAWLHLEQLKLNDPNINKAIGRLKTLDKRLEAFEASLVSLMLKYEVENYDQQNP